MGGKKLKMGQRVYETWIVQVGGRAQTLMFLSSIDLFLKCCFVRLKHLWHIQFWRTSRRTRQLFSGYQEWCDGGTLRSSCCLVFDMVAMKPRSCLRMVAICSHNPRGFFLEQSCWKLATWQRNLGNQRIALGLWCIPTTYHFWRSPISRHDIATQLA